jgi:hypothetical protein
MFLRGLKDQQTEEQCVCAAHCLMFLQFTERRTSASYSAGPSFDSLAK